jgi:hypothetical protein
VRADCKSYQQYLSEICDSHVTKGQNSFVREASSLQLKQSSSACELSGRRAMLTLLENVSNELQRVERAVCEELSCWKRHSQNLLERSRGSNDGKVLDKLSVILTKGDPGCSSRDYCSSSLTAITCDPLSTETALPSDHHASHSHRNGCAATAAAPIPSSHPGRSKKKTGSSSSRKNRKN